MEHAKEREQAPRRIEIHLYFPGQPGHQSLGTFVVQAAPAHVDRLDLPRAGRADGLIIALADEKIILHDAPEGREGEHVGDHGFTVLPLHREHEARIGERDLQPVGPTHGVSDWLEAVFLDQIENGDGTLMFDIRGSAANGLVEFDIGEAGPSATPLAHRFL